MPFWPFKKRAPEVLTAEQLRDKLIAMAGNGESRELIRFCQEHGEQIAENVDTMVKIPDGMSTSDANIDQYFQRLITVAQCLANQCGAPEMFQKLTGNPEDSPFTKWNAWLESCSSRMDNLEYSELIGEVETLLTDTATLRGSTARQYESYFYGRLGELRFHNGQVAQSIKPFQKALELCTENGDSEGKLAYHTSLLEAHRYLDDGQAAESAEQLISAKHAAGLAVDQDRKTLDLLRAGEPRCRVVCVHNGKSLELDEIDSTGDGRYQFNFVRNRLELRKCKKLTTQGNELASAGRYADALEKYYEASEVDPHSPDPVYQSGSCFIELGFYAKAREAFETVEELAPGWFRCRSDRWMADGLERGTISKEEFTVARYLEDGGLDSKEGLNLAKQAVERFPQFAPLHLLYGNFCNNDEDRIAAYRRGLEHVAEPDLESRLLCALAGRLPSESPERVELIQRALNLKGSLVSLATAKLMGLR